MSSLEVASIYKKIIYVLCLLIRTYMIFTSISLRIKYTESSISEKWEREQIVGSHKKISDKMFSVIDNKLYNFFV